MRQRFVLLFSLCACSLSLSAQMNVTGNIAAGQVNSGTLDINRIPTGTTSTTVPLGNDSRFLNATRLNGSDISTFSGILNLTGGTPAAATATVIGQLFGCNGAAPILAYNGTTASCVSAGGTGTVTSVTTGNLSPLFTASFATNTTTPALSFTLSTSAAHTFLGNNTGSTAAPAYVQPAFSDLSGSLAATQLPNPTTSTLGGIEAYTAVSNQFLTSITTSGVPVSAQPSFANLSGTATGAQLPTPQAAALGGIKSSTAAANQFANGVDTTGTVTYAQPSFTNLSGSVAAAQLPTATQVWNTYTVAYTNLSTASTTTAYTVVALTARQLVCGLVEKTATAFAGTGVTGLTATIGDSSGTSTTYSPAAYNLLATVSNTNFIANNVVGMASFAGGNIQVNATSTGANLSSLTAGSLSISVCTTTLP